MSETPSPPQSTEGEGGDGGTSSELAALAILVELLLLGAVLVIGRLLQRAKVSWLGDAGAALLLGLLVGLIIKAAGAGQKFKDAIAFNPNLFLFVMLPTIMWDAGYQLDPRPFVRNLGSICLFAFLGTTIGTFIIGYMMYAFGLAGWCTELSAIHNLLFGAIISATDPVTVLAVFSKLGANEDLYINVFGESVLNDAVAMVLYNTLTGFTTSAVTVGSVFAGIGIFFGIFIGSVVFGVTVGLVAAVLFRTRWFHDEDPLLETGAVVVLAFISYLGATAAHLSGICSVLFCGMVMRSYVRPNLSHLTQLRVDALFKTLAGLFDLFLFVYIGLTLFLGKEAYNIWAYTALVLLALAISRACNIFPLAALTNCVRLPERRMPGKQQFMCWWSGLRGAMAFALAIDAADNFGQAGEVMKTCTFYIIFLTVIINGGAAGTLLDRLDLKQEKVIDEANGGFAARTFSALRKEGPGFADNTEGDAVDEGDGAGGGTMGDNIDAAVRQRIDWIAGRNPGSRIDHEGRAVTAGEYPGATVNGKETTNRSLARGPGFSQRALGLGAGGFGSASFHGQGGQGGRTAVGRQGADGSSRLARGALKAVQGLDGLTAHSSGENDSVLEERNSSGPPGSTPALGKTSRMNRLREFSSGHFEIHMQRLDKALSRKLLGTQSEPQTPPPEDDPGAENVGSAVPSGVVSSSALPAALSPRKRYLETQSRHPTILEHVPTGSVDDSYQNLPRTPKAVRVSVDGVPKAGRSSVDGVAPANHAPELGRHSTGPFHAVAHQAP